MAASWTRHRDAKRRREFLSRLVASLVFHAALVLGMLFAPEATPRPLPPVVSVRLVAAPMARPKAAAPAPKPAAPKPAPKKIILPEKAPAAKRKPRKVARPRPKPLEYEDALSALRKELGESLEPPVEQQPTAPVEDEVADAAQVSPEYLAWQNATRQHVRATWVALGEYRDRDLVTCLNVELTSSGQLLGEPKVVRPSGDPYWDDNAVRALVRASPIPPPPEPGERTFCLPSREHR